MGKYLSIIIGVAAFLAGFLGLIRWWGLMMVVLKGTIPAILICAGLIAVIAGISEIRDESASKNK